MLDVIAADTWTSEALYSWCAAQADVQNAIAALDAAGAALVPLVDASDWQAKGVQSLHALLVDLKDRVGAETGELTSRLWEIQGMAAS